jgi:ribosomal protein S18 acetylase RimI-like enzyme
VTRVRPGHPADLGPLGPAQAALTEPAPELLAGALTREGPATVLVAVDGDPVGYLVAVPGPEVAYVPELAVRPDRQREGHGSALLSALVERTTADELRLTVAADDEAARGFYEHHGFTLRTRIPDRFAAGDGLLLARTVP